MSQIHPPSPRALGLPEVLARAMDAPFHQRRRTAADWQPGTALTWHDWRRVRPMSKEELRDIADLSQEFFIAEPRDVVGYWRSGGVTGRPVFYPRTRQDIAASLNAFIRTLRHAGVTDADIVHVSLPIGIHPAGQQLARAAEQLGAAVVWAGAGIQTPAAEQVRLVRELGATVWVGMPSFGLTMAQRALDDGAGFESGPVRLLITTAERVSDTKRKRLQKRWGASVVDVFGMSELTLLGLECTDRPGFHLWNDVAYCEVLDEQTLRPVPDGTVGMLCVTPLTTGYATPFVRWLSGDMVTLSHECTCPLAEHPRAMHTGRLQGFFKVRGVNVGHDELEALLLAQEEVEDFMATARDGAELVIDVECRKPDEAAAAEIADRVRLAFGIRPTVRQVPLGTVDRMVTGQVKAQRFVSTETVEDPEVCVDD